MVVQRGETLAEVFVVAGDVDLVAAFQDDGLDVGEDFHAAEGEQRGFVRGADEFVVGEELAHGKYRSDGYFSFNVSGGGAIGAPWATSFFMPKLVTFEVTSPRFFLMLSMPREVGPRLPQ